MMKLGIPRTLLATALALVIPLALVSGLGAEGGQPKTDASPSPLAKGLIGTWDFAGTPDKEEEPPAKGGRLKFITGKHWTLTHYDEAGKVTLHQGGTCTIDGDEYTETVNYANESTAENIGKSFKFKVKLEGDKYTQTGLGNPYTEVWRRAKERAGCPPAPPAPGPRTAPVPRCRGDRTRARTAGARAPGRPPTPPPTTPDPAAP